MKKVCIVSLDLVGPVTNGGIGTHAFNLARFLARQDNFEVTLLFSGRFEIENSQYWKKYYSKLNIEFISIEDYPVPTYQMHGTAPFIIKSMLVYDYLKTRDFDFIHFQEWQAHGFTSIQAKKTGLAFHNTVLTVMMHSSTQWINQGMERWYKHPFVQTKMSWCERFCCTHADILLSPSEHMFEWALTNGWNLRERRAVIPYIYEAEQEKTTIDLKLNPKHLIFFGRLENRKGFKVFCGAIDSLNEKASELFDRISFVGKDGMVDGKSGLNCAKKFAEKHPNIQFDFHTEYDTFQAITFIKESGGIAALPSLLDNYPFTVLECIGNGMIFITSTAGGIPEMVDERILFDAVPQSLAGTLESLSTIISTPLQHKYTKEKAMEKWLELHQTGLESIQQHIGGENPKISVCVPYYNLGKYLPPLLQSLEHQGYDNFDVVVVNDGSTEQASVDVFAAMKEKYEPAGWKFYSKENSGVEETRKFAVEQADSEYVIFMDADNLAVNHMIRDFSRGMQYSGADCLTAHMFSFKGQDSRIDNKKPYFAYIPVGACLELGYFENVFGDTNFIIKKDVFLKLGGFIKERTWEDWEFLVRLNLNGYKQYVIPKQLFWYRFLETSRRRLSMDLDYRKYQTLLKTYGKNEPEYFRFTLTNLLLPYYKLKPQSWRHDPNLKHHKGLIIAEELSKFPLVMKLVTMAYTALARVYNFFKKQ
jgi:glycosyltransferase involved in cell wall biosynthesis